MEIFLRSCHSNLPLPGFNVLCHVELSAKTMNFRSWNIDEYQEIINSKSAHHCSAGSLLANDHYVVTIAKPSPRRHVSMLINTPVAMIDMSSDWTLRRTVPSHHGDTCLH